MLSTKPNRCQHCKERFSEAERGHKLHSACIEPWMAARKLKEASKQAKEQKARAKVEKAKDRAKREKLKTNGKRKAEAQAALNRWVVHGRDVDQPCISCGRHHQGIYHAGHYRSRGSAPHLALDPRNLHKQCAPCNLYLHGNLIEYRAGLIRRYGLEYVEALESDQGTKHYTGTDYDAIKALARADLRALKGDWKPAHTAVAAEDDEPYPDDTY
jgi:hypothetical protein